MLGRTGISVTADFFDVGGQSLLAGRLLAQVESAFGRKVPFAVLQQAPTIEKLAARLEGEEPRHTAARSGAPAGEGKWQDAKTQVFAMRREGTRQPLTIVDAGPFQRPLVRRLGSDQPVYGVALPELSALPRRFTVRDIAAKMVEALCASEVKAPYYLAGWSQAGVIAYEMAHLLRSRGREVGLVILFDSNNPTYLRRLRSWGMFPIRCYFRIRKVLYLFSIMRGMPLREGWKYYRERRGKFDLKTLRRYDRDDPSEVPPADTWKVQYLAANGSEPERCDWPLVLIRSTVLQTGWFRDPHLGWDKVAGGGFEVYDMPGEHDAMFVEPHVQRLASIVTGCLHQARTWGATAPDGSEAAVRR
jgi:thioesterase domain-containing protein